MKNNCEKFVLSQKRGYLQLEQNTSLITCEKWAGEGLDPKYYGLRTMNIIFYTQITPTADGKYYIFMYYTVLCTLTI